VKLSDAVQGEVLARRTGAREGHTTEGDSELDRGTDPAMLNPLCHAPIRSRHLI
jgi:hypothetical protein